MTINGKYLTPKQGELVLALLREEAILNRMGEQWRASQILKKVEDTK